MPAEECPGARGAVGGRECSAEGVGSAAECSAAAVAQLHHLLPGGALTSLLSSPSHFSALIVLAMRLPVLAMALAVYYAWKENVNIIHPCMHAGNASLNDMVPAGASLMIGLHGLAEDSFSSHV